MGLVGDSAGSTITSELLLPTFFSLSSYTFIDLHGTLQNLLVLPGFPIDKGQNKIWMNEKRELFLWTGHLL